MVLVIHSVAPFGPPYAYKVSIAEWLVGALEGRSPYHDIAIVDESISVHLRSYNSMGLPLQVLVRGIWQPVAQGRRVRPAPVDCLPPLWGG